MRQRTENECQVPLFLWVFFVLFCFSCVYFCLFGVFLKVSNVMAQTQHTVTQQGAAHYLYWRFENQIAGADFFFVISIA